MGKKRLQTTHVDQEDRRREAEEDELDKEMEALEQIRREREASQRRGIKRKAEEETDEDDDEDEELTTTQPGYNRDALVCCLADWETIQLPFLETMKVEDFAISVQNELDDIEREVRGIALFKFI